MSRYEWPRRPRREGQAAEEMLRALTGPKPRQPLKDQLVDINEGRSWPWWMTVVAVGVVVTIVGVVALVARGAITESNWEQRAGQIQSDLNAMYVEPIIYERDHGGGGRYGGGRIERVVIDGVTREDCTVPDDEAPTLVCEFAPAPTPSR